MFLRLEDFPETRIVGCKSVMSFSANATFGLWRTFMPRRNELKSIRPGELFSLQVYPCDMDFSDVFRMFEKWAAIAVASDQNVPEGMETMVIPKGRYAVFLHEGRASSAPVTFGYIFGNWLPNSGFEIDDRPHFEILGTEYKHDSDDSREEVWIPIR